MTSVEAEDNLDRLFIQSVHDEEDADISSQSIKADEVEYKESKYLAHAKSTLKHENFCTTNLAQAAKRNSFAQRHLFKSGLESTPDQADSDSEGCFDEADLTDPAESQNNYCTENSLGSLAG